MKKRIIYTLFALITLYPSTLDAQNKVNLSQCIEVGLAKNYDIRIVRNEQQISTNNLSKGNAGLLPEVGLTSGYTGSLRNSRQNLLSGGVDKQSNIHNQDIDVGVNLNWTLFDGFKMQSTYNSLKELKLRGDLNARLTIENFVADITSEYYNYVQQNTQFDNLRYAVKLSKERLRIVEARYEIGSSSRLEMQQAKVDFNADSSRLIKQQEVLFRSQVELNKLLSADDVEHLFTTQDSMIVFDALLGRDEIWGKTLSQNTLLHIAQSDTKLSQLDMKIAQSLNYPYLKINGGYGYNTGWRDAASYDRQASWGANYGVTVGFTLFDGNNRKRKIKNAKLEIENAELSEQQLELDIRSQFSNIWMAYQNNIQLVNLEKENLQTAQDNYEIAIDRYKLGDLSGIELREAQNSLLGANERLTQAQYNTKLCEISLLQISGQIMTYLH